MIEALIQKERNDTSTKSFTFFYDLKMLQFKFSTLIPIGIMAETQRGKELDIFLMQIDANGNTTETWQIGTNYMYFSFCINNIEL